MVTISRCGGCFAPLLVLPLVLGAWGQVGQQRQTPLGITHVTIIDASVRRPNPR